MRKANRLLMSKIVFYVLFILLNLNCFSQKEFKFNHLTNKQGLSNNNVTSIIQDKNGFIWFGTASPISSESSLLFDSNEFPERSAHHQMLLHLRSQLHPKVTVPVLR